jgi:membrane-associated phospholipid phosphatase
VCLFAASGYSSVQADVITDWNTLALAAIRNESTAPPLAARNLAILHASIFDAVNAIEPTHESYFVSLTAPPGASAEAAAVGAAYECLADLYPSQLASFDAELSRFLAATPATSNRADGLTLGETTALFVLFWRSFDGSSTTVPYIPGTDPGDWRRTPPFFRPPDLPQWPFVEPFALTNGAQFRPPGPPPLTSSSYAADLNQVKALGGVNSTNRTPEQTLIARFWSDFSYTVTPPGHWNQIAQNIVTNRPTALAENARLFALLNIAMADAGIVVWDAKYVYNFWRPVTAIQQADTDDNPDTEADPSWLPLLNTPSFPEYVSGHSAFSAAAATVLGSFFGTDRVSFTVGSDGVPGVFRSYDSLDAAAEEIALSRIYGGIHFLSADVDGLIAGHQVGEYVFERHLRPIRARLAIAHDLLNNRFLVNVSGAPTRAYVLESSTNLLHWAPIFTNTAPFAFEIAAPGDGLVFFRARATD